MGSPQVGGSASGSGVPAEDGDGGHVLPESGGIGTSAHGRVLARGIAWQAGMRWTSQVLSWVGTVYVARLLTPTDYGIVGLVSWFMLIVAILTDFGIGTTVLTKRDMATGTIAQIHTVVTGLGVVAFGLTVAAAPAFVWFYHEPRVGPVLMFLGSSFVCTALAVVPTAMLQRALRFRALATLDFLRAVCTAGVVVCLAWLKVGYWALVAGNVVGVLVYALATLYLAKQPFHRPRWEAVRAPFAHGSVLLAGSLAYALYNNIDFVIVGKVLGVGTAGLYSLAWTLATLPGEKITNVVQAVIRPLFAAMQLDAHSLGRYFKLTSQLLGAVLTPMFLGLAVVAPDAIPLLLGSQWLPAVPALQCLCFYAITHNLYLMCGHVLVARSQAKFYSWYSAIWAVVLPPIFYFAATGYGLLGVPVVWAVVQPLIMAFPLQRALRSVEMSFASYLLAFLPVAAAGAGMVIAVVSAQQLLAGAGPLVRLAISVAVGAIVYPLVWYLLFREQSVELLRLLRGRTLTT